LAWNWSDREGFDVSETEDRINAAIERLQEIALRDEAKKVTVQAEDLRLVLAVLAELTIRSGGRAFT
jgi:hypothetical protein